MDAGGPPEKRRRGRPPVGDPIPVRLNPALREVAKQLGDGKVSRGVNVALMAAWAGGVEKTKLAAKVFNKNIPDSEE